VSARSNLDSRRFFSWLRSFRGFEILSRSTDLGWRDLDFALMRGEEREWLRWNSSDTILIFMLDGSGTIAWSRDTVTRCRSYSKGYSCLFAPGEPHRIRLSGKLTALVCVVTPNQLSSACQRLYQVSNPPQNIGTKVSFWDDDLKHLGEVMLREFVAPQSMISQHEEILSLAAADYLLRKSVTGASLPNCAEGNRKSAVLHCRETFRRLLVAVDYIALNLHLPELKLEAIAAEVGFSPFHFARMFRSAIGVTPHQYILRERVKLAKSLLQDSSMTIAEVALGCGFSSQSHFTTSFGRWAGATPSVYRNQVRQPNRVGETATQHSAAAQF